MNSYSHYNGRSIGRLLFFLHEYCSYHIAANVTIGNGKILYGEKLFATYTWDGESDIPTFEFKGKKSETNPFIDAQKLKKDQIVAELHNNQVTDREKAAIQGMRDQKFIVDGPDVDANPQHTTHKTFPRMVEFHGPAAWQVYWSDRQFFSVSGSHSFTEYWVKLNQPSYGDILIARAYNASILGIYKISGVRYDDTYTGTVDLETVWETPDAKQIRINYLTSQMKDSQSF